MREILLVNDSGYTALVDDNDYEYICQWKWYAQRKGADYVYARRKDYYEIGKQIDVTMQNQLMHPPDGYEVDHLDHDTLNNCRSNLRICTHQQNIINNRRSKYFKLNF